MSSYASITSVTVPYLSNHIVPSLTACFFLTSPLPLCLSINFLTIYLHIFPTYLAFLPMAFLPIHCLFNKHCLPTSPLSFCLFPYCRHIASLPIHYLPTYQFSFLLSIAFLPVHYLTTSRLHCHLSNAIFSTLTILPVYCLQ